MDPRNGHGPPQFSPLEFKDAPCPGCGGLEFNIDNFASFKVHRFRPEILATAIMQRFTCRGCGWIHGTPPPVVAE